MEKCILLFSANITFRITIQRIKGQGVQYASGMHLARWHLPLIWLSTNVVFA